METEHIYGVAIAIGAVALLAGLMRSRRKARALAQARRKTKRFYDEVYDPKNRTPPSPGE